MITYRNTGECGPDASCVTISRPSSGSDCELVIVPYTSAFAESIILNMSQIIHLHDRLGQLIADSQKRTGSAIIEGDSF